MSRKFGFKGVVSFILAPILLIGLAGCSTDFDHPIIETNKPGLSPSPLESPADIEEAFKQYATASCDLANETGVVETTFGDPEGSVYLIPKSGAVKDFSAAWSNVDGEVGLIWTTESFYACSMYVAYEMSEGQPYYEMGFEFLGDQNSIRLTINQEDMGLIVDRSVITDGVFSEVHNETDGGDIVTKIDYRALTDSEYELFLRAIDEFIADNPEYGK